MNNQFLVSYCGIYCGACPSYARSKTCLGCKSLNPAQKNASKYQCKIRNCCLSKDLDFCFNCEIYPCSNLLKLRNSHLKDDKYEYRHKILYSLVRISKIGLDVWLNEQKELWTCPECGGDVIFYENKCLKCGNPLQTVLKEYMEQYEDEEDL